MWHALSALVKEGAKAFIVACSTPMAFPHPGGTWPQDCDFAAMEPQRAAEVVSEYIYRCVQIEIGLNALQTVPNVIAGGGDPLREVRNKRFSLIHGAAILIVLRAN